VADRSRPEPVAASAATTHRPSVARRLLSRKPRRKACPPAPL
jgi:hypothetical protein